MVLRRLHSTAEMTRLYQRFDTEAAYRTAIDSVLTAARQTLQILDFDLSRMELETPARNRLLANFLQPSTDRKLLVAVHDAACIGKSMPRLVDLLTKHSHNIEIRTIPAEFRHLTDCHVLADGIHGVRRFHTMHARGSYILDDATEVHPWWQRFGDLWGHCTPAEISSGLRI